LIASALISAELPDYELNTYLGKVSSSGATQLKDDYGFGFGIAKKVSDDIMVNLSYLKSNIAYKDGMGDTDVSIYSLAPEYYFNSVSDKLVPYLTAGIGYIDIANSRFDAENGMLVNYGAGLRYIFNEYVNLKLEAKHNYNINESNNHYQYTAGLSIPFYLNTPSAPLDSDRDGVSDEFDKCPNTPEGVAVDLDGCPIDSDKDGVADYLDKCPNTPEGVSVTTDGCPIDSDSDGVPDYLDKCPDTQIGVTVDANGCPLDSDGDGILDYLDQCPNTKKEFKVDEVGCERSYSFYTNFAFNSDKLDAQSLESVKGFSDFLIENMAYDAIVEGHTDSKGSDKYNQTLSEQRAKSVFKALVKFGVKKDRLKYIGYGETKPLADNSTEEGRAQNRRVEGVLVK
jgi:OOP family OmpA-OmpF porin